VLYFAKEVDREWWYNDVSWIGRSRKRAWDTQAAFSFVGLRAENTHSRSLSFVKVFCFI
jgi:hypothetical protein